MIQPNAARLCTKAARRTSASASSAERPIRKPMRRAPSRCCARAASGHAAAPPRRVTNSRRCIGHPWPARTVRTFQLRCGPDPVAFGLRYQSHRVLGQQITAGNQRVGSLLYRGHVHFFGRVAFLDRRPRIARGKPFGLGAGERDEAALERAEAVLEEAAVEQVPAGIGANRNFYKYVADAADVIAVLVDLRNEVAVARRRDLWRIDRDDAGRVLGVIVLPIILHVQRIVRAEVARWWPRETAVIVGRDRRETNLIRGDQRASGDGGACTRRRLGPILDPGGEALQQRAYRPGVRIGIGLLLARQRR